MYRDKKVEQYTEMHTLDYLNDKDELNIKKREYNYLKCYCPVCLYDVKLYIENSHCNYVLHLTNLKYCDEHKQICSLNSRLGDNSLHNEIDEEVKKLVDEDIKHNLIQQSLLDAIRCFNAKLENAMKGNTKY